MADPWYAWGPMHSLTLPVAGGLIGLATVANLLALVFGHPNAAGTGRMIPWLQRSTSLLLALAAWSLALLGAGGAAAAPYAYGIAVGMSLSFVADLIMAEVIRVPDRVLGGIAVFGLAHLAYLAAMLQLDAALDLDAGPAMLGWSVGFLAVALIYWRLAVDTPQAVPPLRLGALGYLGLLATMTGVAWGVATREPALWTLAGGATLFFISDAILGNQIFRANHWPAVGDVVWLTYFTGQAGIVWAVYPALLRG